nr:hypothetical protein [Tanacetum cinerariifolium]
MHSLSPQELERLAKSQVILFSIHSDEWKSFQSQHQTALRGTITLSWKPCNEGSDDGVTTSFQQSQNSRPPMLDHKDKYMMKAQVHVSKSSAISNIQALPRRKYFLLSSGKASVEGEIVSKLSRSRA